MFQQQSKLNKVPQSLIKYQAEFILGTVPPDYNKNQKSFVPNLDSRPSPQGKQPLSDILNAIIPPRQWVDNLERLTIQYVSHNNQGRQDVKRLKQLLEQRLKSRQARQNGICPIRQELFSQAFDQIIRQVTIDCPERGLLLMRVRDQLKMTIAAYQTLYQSSVSFGMRKQLQSEQGIPQLQQEIIFLQKKKSALQDKRIELNSKRESIQKKIKERQSIENNKRQDQLNFLIYQARQLQQFLQQRSK